MSREWSGLASVILFLLGVVAAVMEVPVVNLGYGGQGGLALDNMVFIHT